MNKEELLTKLTELQERISSEVDSYEIEDRVSSIEKISEMIEKNNVEMKYLMEKLSNDNNYIDKKPLQFYMMLEAKELENLKSKEEAERNNENQIIAEQVVIDKAFATITTGKEEQKLLEQNNISLNIAIRRARMHSDNDKVAKCEEMISNNEARISEIDEQVKDLELEIEQHNNVMESLNGLTENLKSQTIEANQKYEETCNLEKSMRNNEVNLASKSVDEEQLLVLKSLNNQSENEVALLSYDFRGELEQIISDFKVGSITDEELKTKLSDFRSRLPQDFLKKDEAERNKELEDNHVTQESLETNIDILNKTLSNEENFKLSPAYYAQNRAKLSSLNMNIKDYDNELIVLHDDQLFAERDREDYTAIIDLCNKENEEYARQLIINNGTDKDLEKSLIEKQKFNFETISQAQELLGDINSILAEDEVILGQLINRKERVVQLANSYERRISEENAIDNGKLRLTQNDLATKQAALQALKNRESFLNNPILNNSISFSLDSIINSNIVNKEVVEENILPFPTEDGVDVNDIANDQLNPIEENKMEPQVVGQINEEVKEDEIVDDNEITPNENDGEGISDEDIDLLDISSLNNPELDESEDKKQKVINFLDDEDGKLKEKSKDDEFKSKFKKHFARVALIAALICLTILGVKACSKEKSEQAMDAIQNDDDAMETIFDNEDQEKSFEDFLNEKGISLDDNEKDNILDEFKKGNVKPNVDPKKNFIGKKIIGGGGAGSSAPFSETIPGESLIPAAPVDPASIIDAHPDKSVHTNPVDPASIPDPHPNTSTPSITATPDKGVEKEVTGVTGGEVVDPGAWNNEVPSIEEDETTEEEKSTETSTEEEKETETPSEEENSTEAPTPEEKETDVPAPDENKTTTIKLNEGEAFLLNKDDVNYVARNESNLAEQDNEQDIFANSGVNSVSINTDEDGKDTISIDINNSELQRDNGLTDEDIDSIQEENDVSKDEIAELEAQYKAQQEALQALKDQVQSSEEQVVDEQTLTR